MSVWGTILLAAIAAGASAFCWRAAGRGFDITDEGFGCLLMAHPQEVRYSSFFDFVYTAPLHRRLGGNLVALRRLLLPATAISSAVFTIGWRLWLADGWPAADQATGTIGLFAFIYIGGLLRYSFASPQPNYNHINATALLTAAGLVLIASQGGVSLPGAIRGLALFAAGLAIGLQTFVKVSSAVSMIGVSVLFLAVCQGPLPGGRVGAMAILGAGTISWGAFHFLRLQPWPRWWRALSGQLLSIRVENGSGPGLLGRLWRDWGDMRHDDAMVPAAAVIVLVSAATGMRLLGRPSGTGPALGLVLFTVFGVLAVRTHLLRDGKPHHSETASIVPFYIGMGATLAGVLLAMGGGTGTGAAIAVAAAYLAVLPLAGAFGTSNGIQLNLVFQLGPWFGLLAWIWGRLAQATATPVLTDAGLVGIAAVTVMQLWRTLAGTPYRLPSPLADQRVATPVGVPAATLYLDRAAHRFILRLQALLQANGFRPGDDILGLFDIPGLVYAVGGKSPGRQWFHGQILSTEAVFEVTMGQAREVPRRRLARAFVLQKGDTADVARCLGWLGLPFPDGYRCCGRAPSPYDGREVVLWRPADRAIAPDTAAGGPD